ncbi:magnesium-dependent phosphatase 1-like [Apis florea]|uniref:magnesium-dependent phosphatase 1-like n=1 Tax=Apis florea TaxID=7463 RepID=UPI000629673F|nr:magnesium-dependent phosphatase 1-like [Apis florea]
MCEKNHKPKIIVFDLDYTLWPFWIDTHVNPPFKKKGNDILDSHDQIIKYYKEVPDILKYLYEEGYELGIASRTSEIQGAKQLLNLFNWDNYFKYKEIYPGSKITHFSRIQKISETDYKDMIFFDDEYRNIKDIEKLGVTCIYVKNGINYTLVENSLKNF